MANRQPFAPNEWYHCYARGVEGRKTFVNQRDYERFLQLLYMTNSTEAHHRSDLVAPTLESVMRAPRTQTLVNVGAYCLMPNHFHLLLQEKSDAGIAKFMQKLGIAYAMYFNIRHHRSGNLFVKPFRSRHVADDRYFQRVLQYIHCNPAELYERGWKSGAVKDITLLQKRLASTPIQVLLATRERRMLPGPSLMIRSLRLQASSRRKRCLQKQPCIIRTFPCQDNILPEALRRHLADSCGLARCRGWRQRPAFPF